MAKVGTPNLFPFWYLHVEVTGERNEEYELLLNACNLTQDTYYIKILKISVFRQCALSTGVGAAKHSSEGTFTTN